MRFISINLNIIQENINYFGAAIIGALFVLPPSSLSRD